MKRTFIDAGVLIAAARGKSPVAAKAMDILDDPEREFTSSDFVKLEVLPKAIHYKREAEVGFYEAFFDSVLYWADISPSIVQEAYKEACQSGLSALDALHVAAAVSVNADELIIVEKPEKVIHRTQAIKVISIQVEV